MESWLEGVVLAIPNVLRTEGLRLSFMISAPKKL